MADESRIVYDAGVVSDEALPTKIKVVETVSFQYEVTIDAFGETSTKEYVRDIEGARLDRHEIAATIRVANVLARNVIEIREATTK